jgi:hypothetical protein
MSVRLNKSRASFSLDVNLLDAFGSEVSEDVALSFGQAVIDTILDRTSDNKSSNGGRFKNYSEEYSESLVFQAYGKTRNDPNLELTGEMLSSVDILEVTPTRLKIGFRDETQRAKAYNHHTGDTVPARPFFNISQSELSDLVERFKPEVDEPVIESFEGIPEIARRFSLLDILGEADE